MEPFYRILIVDDDYETRNLLDVFMTSKGYICEMASDGEEALERASKTSFTAVITDVKMPKIDGITLTRELLKHYPGISVMVMTAFSAEFSEEDAINAGASDFITKPFSLSEFAARFSKMIRDIKQIDVLKDLAHLDVLTGLPNRKLFFDRLTQSIESANRYEHMLGLIFLDLDNFKSVNDTLGHDMGDILLKETALRLMDCVRGSDTVARMGGDEFTIILTKIIKPRGAAVVAQRIVESLSRKFLLGDNACSVSASVGISLYPSDGNDPTTLLKNADNAMYRVKQHGKNGYQFFGDERIDIGKSSREETH